MAAQGKIDPMHQFTIEPIASLHIGSYNVSFTNSALWMTITLVLIFGFMALGMKRQLVPGRWQVAVEGWTGFVDDMVKVNIGPEGKKFVPYIFTLFTFILVSNFLGLLPLAIIPGLHPFTTTSQFSLTGVLAVMSFSIVLIVGFWRHGLGFFKLFVPHGTPLPMIPLIFPIEVISLCVRPITLGVRLMINMAVDHLILGLFMGLVAVAVPIPLMLLGILVVVVQTMVFTLLTCVYIGLATEDAHEEAHH